MRGITYTALLILPSAAMAQSPMQAMFPGPDSCYARSYSATHLADHPAQRVTDFALSPDFSFADPGLTVRLDLRLRGVPGGAFEGYAYCENEAGHLYCGMEGDAGGFQIDPAKGGAILVSVSSHGMSFENDTGFATLERNAGDDRTFLLRPAACR